MTKEVRETKNHELRSEIRKAASEGASIEFKPARDSMGYHFKLRDFSPSGLGILVNKDSDIFKHIKVGNVLSMKCHKGNATPAPQNLRVEIKHISKPVNGKPENHLIIGLYIIEIIEA